MSINKQVENDINSAKPHHPVDTKKLAQHFAREIWNKSDNASSDALPQLWQTIFQSFNELWLRNQSGTEFKKNIIIPAPTGSGKTLCMRFYAAALVDQKEDAGVMIITKLTNEANEAAKQINKWSKQDEDVAVAYHSNSNLKNSENELNDYPVVIMTHEFFIRNHFKGAKNHSTYKLMGTINGDGTLLF